MEFDRRVFLKVAGLTLLGFAAKPGWEVFSKSIESGPSPAQGILSQKRWAMAVHLRKCWEIEGCRDCIDACHRIHNVPDLGNIKEEIKWLWTAPYEKVFPEHEFEYTDEVLTDQSPCSFSAIIAMIRPASSTVRPVPPGRGKTGS